MRSRFSSSPISPSGSESSNLLTPRTDAASISSTTFADAQISELAQQLRTIPLSQDVPIPSIEESSDSSSGGARVTRNTDSSRTPSVALTPSATYPTRSSRASPASRLTNDCVDDRLGMSDVAAALESVGRDSRSPSAFLRPESPAVGSGSLSPPRASRRRSSSRVNQARHDVRDEKLPNDAFHEASFQQSFSDAKRLMAELTEVLSSNTIRHEPDSAMSGLQVQARELARFRCPSTRTVGFVGDSGVGKSSLLNALLDCQGLARTSNGGAACTSVVTEYHYHNADEFAIEVEWFSKDEIVAQLRDLLRSYRYYHLHGVDLDQSELESVKDISQVAEDTFQAMFRGRLEDDGFLTRWSETDIIQLFQSWVEIDDRTPSERQLCNSLDDCSSRLMELTSERMEIQGASKWPYIRKVRVFLKAHILSRGLVLVDLPGLRDLNSARRSITERYLLKCNEIFAVCCIGRAATDASVMSVFETAEKAKLSHVGIVCTRSGDIRPEEAKRDWGGQRARKVQELLDRLQGDKQNYDLAKQNVDSWNDDDDDLEPDEVEELRNATRRLRTAKELLDQHQLELEKYLITTRNRNVTTALESKYGDKLPDNELRIFCVDNIMYQEHRNSPKDIALPFLVLSGILDVRKHCIAMMTSTQLRSARKYINDDIPALLGDIDLWVQSGTGTLDAERRAETRDTLNVLEARLNRELTGNASHVTRIARFSEDIFKEKITRRRRIAYWTTAATRAGDVWAGWAHGSYSAFCRKFGNHETGTVGRHNWNTEAMEQMVNDLAAPWQELRSELRSMLDRDSQFIKDLMDQSMEYTESQLEHSLELANTLGQTMRSRQHLLLADIEQACEDFDDDLSLLRTDALSGIRTSFFGKLMEDYYGECNRESGTGSDRRRKGIIGNRLSDEDVFISLQRRFKKRFSDLAQELQSNTQTAIAVHLSVITNTLDIVRNENAAVESEMDPEFRDRVERVVRNVKEEVRRLQGVMGSSAAGNGQRVGIEV